MTLNAFIFLYSFYLLPSRLLVYLPDESFLYVGYLKFHPLAHILFLCLLLTKLWDGARYKLSRYRLRC